MDEQSHTSEERTSEAARLALSERSKLQELANQLQASMASLARAFSAPIHFPSSQPHAFPTNR